MKAAETFTAKITQGLRLGPVLRLVWQSTPGLTVAGVVLLVFQGLLPLVGLYLMKLIIDAVTGSLDAPAKPGALKQVMRCILLVRIFIWANFSHFRCSIFPEADQGRSARDVVCHQAGWPTAYLLSLRCEG